MIHPDTELRFISSEVGYGVFATKLIPKGTITWALDKFDLVYEPAKVLALSPIYQEILEKYAYVDPSGNYVLCWDLGRYINHSCNPTNRGVGYGFDIAVRDIQAGEELTYEYATLNITNSFECRCGSPNCRSLIHSNDILRYGQEWDKIVADALGLITKVSQPLWTIAVEENEKDRAIIAALLNQELVLPSCLDYHFQGSIDSKLSKESVISNSSIWQIKATKV